MARSILTEVKRSLAFFSVCLFGVAGLLPLIPLSACSNEFPKITNPDASTTDPPVGEDGAIPEEGGVIPLPDGAVDPGVPLTFIRDLTVQIMPSDRGASILDAIRTAKTSIHMEMYLLTNSSVINALKTAKQQGRDVKVVLNQDFPQGGNGNASAFNELKNAGVGVVYAPPAFTFAHAKTIVIDGASGWIMTMNLTQTSPTDNREYLVRVTGAAEVAELEAIFNADFTNKSVDLPGRLVVSPGSATPVDPQKRMVALMRGATSQIDLEGESLSDNQIVETLIAAKKAGRTVRVILNDQESSPGQVTAIAAIKAAGIPIVKVTTPDIHAKAIVVDRARAYVGGVAECGELAHARSALATYFQVSTPSPRRAKSHLPLPFVLVPWRLTMLLNRATGKPLTPANREGVPSSHDAPRKGPGLGFRRTLTPAGTRDARARPALGSKARADAKSGPFALALGVCWFAACASPIAPVEAPSSRSLASAPASSRLHVRSTPDEDPSRFLGAFVKRGVRPDDISEGDAVRTRCSSSFRVVRVPATQEFDESFEVRKEAGASVGLTAGLGLEGSAQSTGTLRIHYRTTEKLVVEVDADALGRCCRAAPSECTDTVVGEFVRASGQVFTGTTSEQTAKAGFTHPVGSVGANAGSKNDWKAVSRFENTYFAFATRSVALPTVSAGAADPTDCSFCAQLPTSLDGKYFCGLSEPSPSESAARAAAMANAREQVLHTLSETLSLRTTLGPVNKLVVAERASSGLVSGVKDERWCPSKATATSEGPRYEAKVLAFVPKTLLGKAASDAVLGVVEERRRAGTLTPDQERELRAMATRLSHGEEP